MKNIELNKRIITSLFLLIIGYLMFSYTYIMIISLIVISLISWIEFYGLISKIFTKNELKINFFKSIIKILSLIYLIIFSLLIFNETKYNNYDLHIFYLISICILSDIGGLVIGKTVKGKKLTKISPNKTISGSLGSFFFSILLVPIFYYFSPNEFPITLNLIVLTIIVSLTCQLGDLFISYLKRKAKVKNTGDLLPGHGGFLDRIDGILFAVPDGIIIWELLIEMI